MQRGTDAHGTSALTICRWSIMLIESLSFLLSLHIYMWLSFACLSEEQEMTSGIV